MIKNALVALLIVSLLLMTVSAVEDVEQKTVLETVMESENLSTFVEAIEATDLVASLNDETASFTVFAPSNSAFDALPEGALDDLMNDTEALTERLNYHLLGFEISPSDLEDGMSLETLQGKNLTITIVQVEADDVDDQENDGEDASLALMVDGALIEQADIVCSNGIVHVIDVVMFPPADEAEATDESIEPAEESVEAEPQGLTTVNWKA